MRGERPIRRFYLELVRYRRDGGRRSPLAALTTSGMRRSLDELGALSSRNGVEARVAALVELGPGEAAAEVEGAARVLGEHGVSLDVWPQLPDDETRWLNTATAARVHRELGGLLDDVLARGQPAALGLGLCLDVEPTLALMRALRRGFAPRAAARVALELSRNVRRATAGRAALRSLARDLEGRGLPVHVAVPPPFGVPALDTLLGCPVRDDDGRPLFGRPAPMCYASMLRPLSRGRRDVERALFRRAARRHARAFAPRPLAIALGLLSHGVLGDEPVYDDVVHLEQDLDDALALGFHDVSFFSLEGALFGAAGVPGDDDFAPTRPSWRDWLARLVR